MPTLKEQLNAKIQYHNKLTLQHNKILCMLDIFSEEEWKDWKEKLFGVSEEYVLEIYDAKILYTILRSVHKDGCRLFFYAFKKYNKNFPFEVEYDAFSKLPEVKAAVKVENKLVKETIKKIKLRASTEGLEYEDVLEAIKYMVFNYREE